MIEMPEAVTIARQMDETLKGKTIQGFERGGLTHKFLWLTKPVEEYDTFLRGQQISEAKSYGRSILLYLGEENLVLFADLGGRILYHPPGQAHPAKYHLRWDFVDESAMTYSLQMWGFVGLLAKADLAGSQFANVGIPPLSNEFTLERFNQLLEEYPEKTRKGIKGFLTTTRHVHGIGNAYLQDILHRAKIHPARKIPSMNLEDRQSVYIAIQSIIEEAIRLGGRAEERDLFDHPGGYHRLMNSQAVGKPCPACGTPIQKITYLGGACYFCPTCQV